MCRLARNHLLLETRYQTNSRSSPYSQPDGQRIGVLEMKLFLLSVAVVAVDVFLTYIVFCRG